MHSSPSRACPLGGHQAPIGGAVAACTIAAREAQGKSKRGGVCCKHQNQGVREITRWPTVVWESHRVVRVAGARNTAVQTILVTIGAVLRGGRRQTEQRVASNGGYHVAPLVAKLRCSILDLLRGACCLALQHTPSCDRATAFRKAVPAASLVTPSFPRKALCGRSKQLNFTRLLAGCKRYRLSTYRATVLGIVQRFGRTATASQPARRYSYSLSACWSRAQYQWCFSRRLCQGRGLVEGRALKHFQLLICCGHVCLLKRQGRWRRPGTQVVHGCAVSQKVRWLYNGRNGGRVAGEHHRYMAPFS